MPIKVPNNLPAKETLEKEQIFFMHEDRAVHQDIRELNIVILNLMPIKHDTETQLLRLLGNTPLQIQITLLHPKSHTSKNTPEDHLLAFYHTFENIKHLKFDGMIITGAPVEQLPFEEVNYWEELKEIMEWSKTNVTSTLHICWGAQAGLYYHYGIQKYPLSEKMFGVFKHNKLIDNCQLVRGFDEEFYAPHSRHTEIHSEDIINNEKLILLSSSDEAGVYLAASKDMKQIFVTGHSEYDRETLKKEYIRDLEKGLAINMPYNYFPNNDVNKKPLLKWKGHANLLFSNWLNYCVYQITPYNWE